MLDFFKKSFFGGTITITTTITTPPPAGRALENANPAWETIPLTDGRKGDPQLYVEGKMLKQRFLLFFMFQFFQL